jgi:NAD(P)-dependent dehydrogenase (short-subunit alcohol dehydrogenase family)
MKYWLITGASRGLGRAFAEAALERGDKVAMTSRNPRRLDDLVARFGEAAVALPLDLTRTAEVTNVFQQAVERCGHLDVVVNNAGYILLGAVEEITEQEAREQVETLFFGPLFLTKEAVRHMRERGSGTIVQVSSLAGIGGLPGNSMYGASKWALEGMCEALRQEVKDFGIRVIILQPAGIRTDIAHGIQRSRPLSYYDEVLREQRERWVTGEDPHATGDAKRCAQVLLDLVDRSDPPFRLALGSFGTEIGRLLWRQRIEESEAWDKVSRSVNPSS